MPITSSIAKISQPRIRNVYLCTRLFERLDRARDYPVIWITAPAGSGKTVLTASYLAENKVSNIWFKLDPGDADFASFFYYLAMAGNKAAPRRCKHLPLLTPEYAADITKFTRTYFRELYSLLKPPAVIVFDNYQDIPDDTPFHEMITAALGEIPEGVNVIIVSRASPPSVYTKLRANECMDLLDWDDLQLTEKESAAIALLHCPNNKPSEKTLKDLYGNTQGWVAGLVLLLERLNNNATFQSNIERNSQDIIFDFFSNEVFDQLDINLQRFLLKACLLPNMTVKTAVKLTGECNAGRILSNLAYKNYFTLRHNDQTASFEFHALFRLYLLARAAQEFSESDLIKLKHHASVLLMEDGYAEYAADILIEIEDWQALVELISKNAEAFFKHGRQAVIECWIKNIPEELHCHQPWLLYWLASCRLRENPAEARGQFEQAFAIFQQQQCVEGLYLSWCGVVESFFHQCDCYTLFDRWYEELKILQKNYPVYPSKTIEGRVFFTAFTALFYHAPQHPDFLQWVSKAEAIVEYVDDPSYRLLLGAKLCMYYSWFGKISKLNALAQTLEPISQSKQITPLAVIHWNINKSMRGWVTADWDVCEQGFRHAIDVADRTSVHVMDSLIFAQAVYGYASMGHITQAENYLEKVAALINFDRRMEANQYHMLAGWVASMHNDVGTAFEHARIATREVETLGTPFPDSCDRIAFAQSLFAKREKQAAAKQIERSLAIAREIKTKLLEFAALCTQAWFHFENGDEKSGLEVLRQAMRVGRIANLVNFPYWQSATMSRLCSQALQANIEVNYVKHLIQKRQLVPDYSLPNLDCWPWPVKVFTLGRFELVVDDQPVRFNGKAQKKPLELLKALLAFGGRDVAVEKLMDTLWPDAEGDAAYSAFTMTLQRLRKIIVHGEALELSEGKLSFSSQTSWVDAWSFERLLEQGSTQPSKTEQAITLYHGPFLSSSASESWSLSIRLRLRRKFLKAIKKTGIHKEAQHDWQGAIEFYLRGLDVDDVAEEFYQGLMRCYEQLGQRADVIKSYQRCCEILAARLQIEPSRQTLDLYSKFQARSVKNPTM